MVDNGSVLCVVDGSSNGYVHQPDDLYPYPGGGMVVVHSADNAFGGWKASGSTGKGSGDIYYLLQFLRQQSRAFPLKQP